MSTSSELIYRLRYPVHLTMAGLLVSAALLVAPPLEAADAYQKLDETVADLVRQARSRMPESPPSPRRGSQPSSAVPSPGAGVPSVTREKLATGCWVGESISSGRWLIWFSPTNDIVHGYKLRTDDMVPLRYDTASGPHLIVFENKVELGRYAWDGDKGLNSTSDGAMPSRLENKSAVAIGNLNRYGRLFLREHGVK